MHSIVDVLLGVGSMAAVLAAVFVAFHLNRRAELEQTVQDTREDVVRIESHLETVTGYRPRTR